MQNAELGNSMHFTISWKRSLGDIPSKSTEPNDGELALTLPPFDKSLTTKIQRPYELCPMYTSDPEEKLEKVSFPTRYANL